MQVTVVQVLILLCAGVVLAERCYDTPGCIMVDVPACNKTTNTCYVHWNVCGSLRKLLLMNYLKDGFHLKFVATEFECTQDNTDDCHNEATILSYDPLTTDTNMRYCVPNGLSVFRNNLTFSVLGSPVRHATIFVPPPDNNCTLLTFTGNNIRLSQIRFDGTNCSGTPSKGIRTTGTNYTFTDVIFNNVDTGVSLIGANIGAVLFDGVSATPTTPVMNNKLWQMAIVGPTTGTITSTSSVPYQVTTYGGGVLVTAPLTQHDVYLNFEYYADKTFKYVPPTANTTCPDCKPASASDWWIGYLVMGLIILGLVGLIAFYAYQRRKEKQK